MSRSAGPGSPVYFQCAWARTYTDWRDPRRFEGHDVKLTGRTRARGHNRGAIGLRSSMISREYVCSCGHRGWSNHIDLERMEMQGAPLVAVLLGHDLQPDPVGGISSVWRWTCTKCGRAVLRNGDVVYGSAVEHTCP